MAERGIDNCSSLKYESLLKESGAFSEIHVRKIDAPLSGQSDGEHCCYILNNSNRKSDPILKPIGAAVRLSSDMIIPQMPGRLSSPRLTDAMAQEVLAELHNPSNKFCAHFYVLWARKNL